MIANDLHNDTIQIDNKIGSNDIRTVIFRRSRNHIVSMSGYRPDVLIRQTPYLSRINPFFNPNEVHSAVDTSTPPHDLIG